MLTAHDLQMQLLDLIGGAADTLAVTKARRAIAESYSDLAQRRQWNYYLRQGRLVTEAAQTTGTVVYDHTGGSSERMLTLTGGTWPDNARYGTVILGEAIYPIASRVSSTVVTLDSAINPGADVASTTYRYYRDSYPLPETVNQISGLYEAGRVLQACRMGATEWLTLRTCDSTVGQPREFVLMGDRRQPGLMQVVLHPAPDIAYQLYYVYRMQPVPLRVFDETAGTISCAASTTVTGTGTAFTENMVGSVLRFGTVSQTPTEYAGAYPAVFEGRVQSVASGTSLTLEEAPTATYTGIKYRLSDLVDIENGAMRTALLRMAEYHMALLMPQDVRDISLRASVMDKALRLAGEADSRRIEGRSTRQHWIEPVYGADVT